MGGVVSPFLSWFLILAQQNDLRQINRRKISFNMHRNSHKRENTKPVRQDEAYMSFQTKEKKVGVIGR